MKSPVEETVRVPLAELRPHPSNPHVGDVDEIAASLRAHGQFRAVVVSRRTNHILAGNHTVKALHLVGAGDALVHYVDASPDEELKILAVDNRTARAGHDDPAALSALLEQLRHTTGLTGSGYNADEADALLDSLKADTESITPRASDEEGTGQAHGPSLADRFGVPPFSILDGCSGTWQDRKREWLALGCIAPKIGSDLAHDGAAFAPDANEPQGNAAAQTAAKKKDGTQVHGAARGEGGANQQMAPNPNRPGGKRGKAAPSRRMTWAAGSGDDDVSRRNASADRRLTLGELKNDYNGTGGVPTSGTSIFDPVLCELMLRWYSPPGGRVLDPFAGGTSLGVVTSMLGRQFVGVEVREDQVAANANIVKGHNVSGAQWVCGDSALISPHFPGGDFDLVLTDPPYFTLEKYSGDARDGSTKGVYVEFLAWYVGILTRAADVLKDDRFFVVKMGEARGKDGHYPGIVGDTIRTLQRVGLHYHTDYILRTAMGSLPVRTSRAFVASRRPGRAHQNVLVMVKGDVKRAVAALGPVDVEIGSDLADSVENTESYED